jgi:3-hydroxybutyrate dehydrogenase
MKSKTAVITGSTSGIGLGIARTFAKNGMNVLLNGLGDPQQIEETRKAIEAEFKVRAIYSPANMTQPSEIRDMIALAEKTFGGVDVLVNNAGIQFVSPVEDFPEDKWNAIIAINLSSVFHATRAAMPGMKARNFGRIINIASAHGLVASPFKSAYVSAKHGVVGFTKSIALETADLDITCNAICPGYVNTPLVQGQIDEQAKAHNLPRERVIREVILAAQPKKVFTEVDQLAEMAYFLCTAAASTITGTSLQMDGGWTAR